MPAAGNTKEDAPPAGHVHSQNASSSHELDPSRKAHEETEPEPKQLKEHAM